MSHEGQKWPQLGPTTLDNSTHLKKLQADPEHLRGSGLENEETHATVE